VKLLGLLAQVNTANEVYSSSDISDGERLRYADILANKFISHALIMLHLLDDTNVLVLPSSSFPPIKIIFAASASIDVLTRASLEAFLVFHHVFYAPTTTEEKNYRYWSYKAAGIVEWQNGLENMSEYEQEKAEEKKELNKLSERLKSNTVFQSLTDSQKKRILKGEWRWEPGVKNHVSWSNIASDAGFSKMLASPIYRYLSGSAHSSSTSILRMDQALRNKEPEKLIKPSIDTMNVLVANMIREYCALYPRAQDVLRESGASSFVEVWGNVGRQLGDNTETG
jgi:hypothetical protein